MSRLAELRKAMAEGSVKPSEIAAQAAADPASA
jgi:hypothetical protein